MKKVIFFMFAVIMFLAMVGCSVANGASDERDERVELVVAAAASLANVTEEITLAYRAAAPNVKLTFTYASSGSLQTQIEQGAPIDVFISAASRQMDALDNQSLLLEDSRIDLLQNKIVLVTPSSSQLNLQSFDDLTSDKVKMVAYGDPSSVPAGQYAQEVLISLNIAEALAPKTNYSTDVRQVLTWLQSGNVDVGIVYATDAASAKNIKIVCEAPQGSVGDIVYPVAITAGSSQIAAAQAFIDFLQSRECAAIFENYGFTMAE